MQPIQHNSISGRVGSCCFAGIAYQAGCSPLGITVAAGGGYVLGSWNRLAQPISALVGHLWDVLKDENLTTPANLHKWSINDNEVRVTQENNRLVWEVFKWTKLTKQKGSFFIPNLESHLTDDVEIERRFAETREEFEKRQTEFKRELAEKSLFRHLKPVIEGGKVVFLKPVYECGVDEKRVNIFQLQDRLVYQLFDKKSTHKIQQGPLPPIFQGPLAIQKDIEYFKKSVVSISNEDLPTFDADPQLILLGRWTFGHRESNYNHPEVVELEAARDLIEKIPSHDIEVSLIQRQDELFWQVFEKYPKDCARRIKNPWLPANNFFGFERFSKEHRIEHLKNFIVGFFTGGGVALLLASKNSFLDPSVRIDVKKWAVTIIDTGAFKARDPKTWGGHAMIVIEGIKLHDRDDKARYFMLQADFGDATGLCGNARVRLFEDGHIKPEDLRYSRKSKIFLVRRSLVEPIIEKIREQHNSRLSFHFFSYNCLKWVLDTVGPLGIALEGYTSLINLPNNVLDKIRCASEGQSTFFEGIPLSRD